MPERKGEGPFRCPRCAAVTWGDLNFCMECGQELYVECPGCGATWRYFYEYPFCPNCGTKIKKEIRKTP